MQIGADPSHIASITVNADERGFLGLRGSITLMTHLKQTGELKSQSPSAQRTVNGAPTGFVVEVGRRLLARTERSRARLFVRDRAHSRRDGRAIFDILLSCSASATQTVAKNV